MRSAAWPEHSPSTGRRETASRVEARRRSCEFPRRGDGGGETGPSRAQPLCFLGTLGAGSGKCSVAYVRLMPNNIEKVFGTTSWRSTRMWVDEYIASRYRRERPPAA